MQQDQTKEPDDAAFHAFDELYQPLTAILFYARAAANWMNRDEPDHAEARRAINGLLASGQQAADMMHLMQPARTERPPAAVMEINDIIADAVSLTAPLLQRHAIVCDLDLSDTTGAVCGNRVRLTSLVVSLISNAVDAMRITDDRERRLAIESRLSERGDILVAVEDNGAGIDPRQIDRVFDPYFTTKDDGMGLGLAACRATIAAHGGRVWATHNRPFGSVFSFTMPSAGLVGVTSAALAMPATPTLRRERPGRIA